MDLLNERGKEIFQQADATNQMTIEAQLSETSCEWSELISGLEGRRGALEALSKHWEELEARWSKVEAGMNGIEERSKLVDTVVRSKQHILDTIKVLDVSLSYLFSTTIC